MTKIAFRLASAGTRLVGNASTETEDCLPAVIPVISFHVEAVVVLTYPIAKCAGIATVRNARALSFVWSVGKIWVVKTAGWRPMPSNATSAMNDFAWIVETPLSARLATSGSVRAVCLVSIVIHAAVASAPNVRSLSTATDATKSAARAALHFAAIAWSPFARSVPQRFIAASVICRAARLARKLPGVRIVASQAAALACSPAPSAKPRLAPDAPRSMAATNAERRSVATARECSRLVAARRRESSRW